MRRRSEIQLCSDSPNGEVRRSNRRKKSPLSEEPVKYDTNQPTELSEHNILELPKTLKAGQIQNSFPQDSNLSCTQEFKCLNDKISTNLQLQKRDETETNEETNSFSKNKYTNSSKDIETGNVGESQMYPLESVSSEIDTVEINMTVGPKESEKNDSHPLVANVICNAKTERHKLLKCVEHVDDRSKPIRKRKWLTKKCCESKEPVLAISTDSLRDLIACVDMVPLSDIKFDSSSDFENSQTDREEGEKSPTPENKKETVISGLDNNENGKKFYHPENPSLLNNHVDLVVPFSFNQLNQSPLPSEASNILYITNLVRPFTILQLKGLLSRTGKIVENGFWIDRIKSRCFVQYETEEQAVETRHALHGVRWPVSNPKCLLVEFGSKKDMETATSSVIDIKSKFGSDSSKDVFWNTGWDRDLFENEKKTIKVIREWDVGKKDNLDQERKVSEKLDNDLIIASRENGKDRRNHLFGSEGNSVYCPVMKKANEPPMRLLDDLFRKTKAMPSVYWLPLTPEQIAEKEEFRLKRVEEHKARIKQRELDRVKDREKERDNERNRIRYKNRNERERERNREYRHNYSSDRRRSRSHDRRN